MSSGKALYLKMLGTDFTPILETAVRECGCKTLEEAGTLLDAFLQWFSLIPMLHPGEALQMLRKVDPIWHAFVLNTKLYREFCDEFIGTFIDHDPMEVTNADLPKETYAALTLKLLRQEFGDDMQPSLGLLAEGATCCYWKGANASRRCKSRTGTVSLTRNLALARAA